MLGGFNLPCRIIPIQGFYFADNFGKLLGDMMILTFNPFVRTGQGYFLGNLRWCEIDLVIAERLDNRTDFCRIFSQLFQLLLLYVEFVGLVFKFGLILGNEFLNIRFLRLIPVEGYPAGNQFLFRLFKLAALTENL